MTVSRALENARFNPAQYPRLELWALWYGEGKQEGKQCCYIYFNELSYAAAFIEPYTASCCSAAAATTCSGLRVVPVGEAIRNAPITVPYIWMHAMIGARYV